MGQLALLRSLEYAGATGYDGEIRCCPSCQACANDCDNCDPEIFLPEDWSQQADQMKACFAKRGKHADNCQLAKGIRALESKNANKTNEEFNKFFKRVFIGVGAAFVIGLVIGVTITSL